MNGGECFQGAMDDLRIYREALSPSDIASLYRSGLPTIDRLARVTDERIAAFLVPGKSFAETLANTRQRIAQSTARPDSEVIAALLRRIKARHAEAYAEFLRSTGLKPLDYLQAPDAALNAREAGLHADLVGDVERETARLEAFCDEAGRPRVARRLPALARRGLRLVAHEDRPHADDDRLR